MRWRAERLRGLAWLLRRIHRDFPGRWRVERFAVREVRSVGPQLRPVVVRARDGFCAGRVLDVHEPDIIVELNGPEADRVLRDWGYAAFAIDGKPLGQVTGQMNAYFTRRPRMSSG